MKFVGARCDTKTSRVGFLCGLVNVWPPLHRGVVTNAHSSLRRWWVSRKMGYVRSRLDCYCVLEIDINLTEDRDKSTIRGLTCLWGWVSHMISALRCWLMDLYNQEGWHTLEVGYGFSFGALFEPEGRQLLIKKTSERELCPRDTLSRMWEGGDPLRRNWISSTKWAPSC